MGEAIEVSGAEDEAAAELEWILLDPMLTESCLFGFLAAHHVVLAQQVEDIRFFQFHRLVCLAPVVNEEREGDAGLLDESAREDEVPETHGGQVRSPLFEVSLMFAQLRDVLSAEDSTVVPEEDDHRRTARPKQIELDRTLIRIW